MAKKATFGSPTAGADALKDLITAITPLADALQEESVQEEAVQEEAVQEEAVQEEPAGPKTYTITLQGPKNQSLDYGINGVFAKLPCGVEIEVSESVYNAVKAHIVSERE